MKYNKLYIYGFGLDRHNEHHSFTYNQKIRYTPK